MTAKRFLITFYSISIERDEDGELIDYNAEPTEGVQIFSAEESAEMMTAMEEWVEKSDVKMHYWCEMEMEESSK